MEMTYGRPDYLCVGCFGWARSKTPREAYRVARAYASPQLCKPEGRVFRVFQVPDQVDRIEVGPMGDICFYGAEGVPEGTKLELKLHWTGNEKAKLTAIPE